jgi:hypothetical protein
MSTGVNKWFLVVYCMGRDGIEENEDLGLGTCIYIGSAAKDLGCYCCKVVH